MPKSQTFITYGVLTLVQLGFSGWHVLGSKALANGLKPLVFACYRELLALILMYAVALFFDGFRRMRRRHLFQFILLGLFNYGNVVGFIVGMSLTSSDIAAIYQCCIPVFTILLGWWTGEEELNKFKISGILFAVLGAGLTTFFSFRDYHGQGIWIVVGNLLLVAQTISISALIVFQRPMLERYPPSSVVAWGYTGATILCLVSALSVYWKDIDKWLLKGEEEPIALSYAAVVATLMTYMLMAWANKQTNSSIVSVFMTLQPVFTSVISYFALEESLTLPEILGGLVVMIGLFLTCWAKHVEEERVTVGELSHFLASDSQDEETKKGSDSYHSSRHQTSLKHYHTPHERRDFICTGYTPDQTLRRETLPTFGEDRISRPLSADTLTTDFRHTRTFGSSSYSFHGERAKSG